MTALRIVSLAFVVLYPLLELLCYGLLRWRRNDLAIRKRNKWSICIASLAGWLAYFNLIVSLFGGVPCGIFYVVSLLVAPMSAGPQLVRALTLKGTLQHSTLVTEDDIVASRDRDHNGRRASRSSDTSEKKIEANLVLMKTHLLVKVTIAALIAVPTLVLVVAFAMTSDVGNLLATEFDQCNSEPAFIFLTPAFGIASTALALLATFLIRKAQDELGLRMEILRNVIFLGVTYVVILIIRLLGYYEWQPLLQTIQQMFLSFSMILIPCLSAFEFLPPSVVVKQTNQASSVASTATSSTLPGYAKQIPRSTTRSSIIGGRINVVSPATMKQQEQRAREMTVSWDAGLCILLSTQEGINKFSQHCAREFSSENGEAYTSFLQHHDLVLRVSTTLTQHFCLRYPQTVRFWVAVNEYKAKFDEESCPPSSTVDTDDDETETSDAAVGVKVISESEIFTLASSIYASFVEDTEHQVNLSSKHKSELKKAIDSKQLTKYTFDASQKEIFRVMASDSYPRYLCVQKKQKR